MGTHPIFESDFDCLTDMNFLWRTLLAAFANMIGASFQQGYALGVMNSLTEALEDVFDKSSDLTFSFTTALSLTQAIWALGGAFGSQIGGVAGEKLGRKNTLLVNNIFLVTGCLLQFFTFQFNDWSYNWIIIGRFLNGIGCGVSMTVSPVYLMENAPENLKGAFGCSFSIFFNIGLFVAFVLGLTASDMKLGTLDSAAFVVGFPILGCILQCMLLPLVYDSPVSLASRQQVEKSRRASVFYGVPEIAQSQSDTDSNHSTTHLNTQKFTAIIRDPLFYKPLIVCCIMMMIGQFNGINSIQFYSTIMFESAGMENPKIGTVVVGIITIIITLVTTYLLTRFGRKTLMQISLGGMFLCCLVTGSVLVSIGEETNRTMSIVAVTFILIFVVFFQIGAGPIPPFITSDFFDATLRPRAASISVLINWISIMVMGAAYPPIENAIGSSVFFIFAAINLISMVYVQLCLPETKDKTLTEIHSHFKKNNKSKNMDSFEA